jgi:two-component system response regulator ResD
MMAPANSSPAQGLEAGIPRILVVLDEPDLATTCQRYLAQLGYAVRVALDRAGARALVDANWADLVILDLQFAGQVDVLGLLGRPGGRPVVVCIGRNSDLARRQALATGAATYLAKPFSLHELRAAIDDNLGRRRAEGADAR